MAIAFVGALTGAAGISGSATTGTRTTTTGNFLASAHSSSNSGNASVWRTTVATTQALTIFGNRATGGTDGINAAYLANITGHTNDSILATSTTFVSTCGGEFSGVKTTSPLDASANTGGGSGAYTSGATFSCPTVTTTVTGDLVIGVATIETGSSGTYTGTGGWTVAAQFGDGTTSSTSVLVYQIVGAPGTYTPTFTFNQNGTASIGQTLAFLDANPAASFVRPTIIVPTAGVQRSASW